MKVGFFNKKLWKQYSVFVSAFAGLASLILAFFDICQKTRIKIGIAFILVLVIAYVIFLVFSNCKNEQELIINETTVKIIYGDLFQQNGLKVIAFNEFFDTSVDDRIISRTSLNGQFITSKVSSVYTFDSNIEKDARLRSLIIAKDVDRIFGGKKTRYKLGSCYKYEDYILLAFTHFDEENRAYLTIEDYVACLMQMWNELDVLYNGSSIVIPLLGSGITRLRSEMSPGELLKELIWTYKASCVKFSNATLTIVLPERFKKEINLFDIGKE